MFKRPQDLFLLPSITLICSSNHGFSPATLPNMKAIQEFPTPRSPSTKVINRVDGNCNIFETLKTL